MNMTIRNMKKNHIRLRGFLSIFICVSLLAAPAFTHAETTAEKIEQQKEKIDDLKDQKEEAEETVKEFEEIRQTLQEKLDGLNDRMESVSDTLERLQAQIIAKEEEITQKEADLAQAQKTADEQYEAMKKRIQFIYENGDDAFVQALFGSRSIADFIDRSSYVQSLSSYDRQMMTDYEDAITKVEEERAILESEKEDLLLLQNEADAQKSQVSVLISDTKTDIDTSISALATAQELSDAITKQIEEAEAYEKQLEQQKADEDAKRLVEIAKQESNFTSSGAMTVDATDEQLLAAIIYCEARGESYEGQLAVGSVVLNRVDSPSFPNTIAGVIYQSGQFSPVASGKLAMVLANGLQQESCNQAAKEVLAGNRTNNFLYFRSANVTFSFPVTIIGNHAFY